MKCVYHPEADAVSICTSCISPICVNCGVRLGEKTYCKSCINKALIVKKEEKRSVKLIIGGILGIIAGALSFLGGIGYISEGLDKEFWYESTNWAQVGWGIAMMVIGITAVAGSCFSLARRYFGLALAGATCAIIPFWFLGIPALLLVAFSKDDFDQKGKDSSGPNTEFRPHDIYQPRDPFKRDKWDNH